MATTSSPGSMCIQRWLSTADSRAKADKVRLAAPSARRPPAATGNLRKSCGATRSSSGTRNRPISTRNVGILDHAPADEAQPTAVLRCEFRDNLQAMHGRGEARDQNAPWGSRHDLRQAFPDRPFGRA